ncbi:methyltransferase, TIGR04325 family [Mucilaginibacter ginkgonis]|uniref:Methyltransferase, TIGR04325 family n=1 Tax=Mucilaginibacter ginkgonis TaxID=2682091 RepID=A0A6I4I5B8_9SPHI|nr:methyltransferase, TIGR04325 family [Mucilaginibacter ginkgonis]QQL48422.1 methyltransferase, TIGR04325 family [Mucilaginibacter ginkgonis]
MALKKGEFVPAIVKRILRHSFKYGWHGRYQSWQQALSKTTGYNAGSVLQRVRAAAAEVKNGRAVYERDAITYDHVEVAYPLLATLLWIASLNGNNLSIIDYGGSLGTSYRQNYPFLKHLKTLQWGLIEQEMFVTEGKANFEDQHLKFYYNLEECLAAQANPQLWLFSSSLQYMEKPYELLQHVKDSGIEFFMIDRTAFIDEPDDRLTIQSVPPAFYDASYPCWFFSESKMNNFLADTFEPVYDFLSGQKVVLGLDEMDYKGRLWRRKQF